MTRYELVARRPDGAEVLVAYTAGSGRHHMLKAARQHEAALGAWGPVGDDDLWVFRREALRRERFRWTAAAGAIELRYSGRTLRGAVADGELPWIEEVVR